MFKTENVANKYIETDKNSVITRLKKSRNHALTVKPTSIKNIRDKLHLKVNNAHRGKFYEDFNNQNVSIQSSMHRNNFDREYRCHSSLDMVPPVATNTVLPKITDLRRSYQHQFS